MTKKEFEKKYNLIPANDPLLNNKLELFDFRNPPVDPEELGKDLLEHMRYFGGIGLSANQLGMPYRVFVMEGSPGFICFNPRISAFAGDEVQLDEGCLSYPGDGIHTTRYKHIHITTAQEDSGWYFSGVENVGEGKGSWEAGNKDDEQLRLLETICVQHEIDHLNGITIHNRESKPEPIVSKKVPGRNEKCPCGSGKKFKKCCM